MPVPTIPTCLVSGFVYRSNQPVQGVVVTAKLFSAEVPLVEASSGDAVHVTLSPTEVTVTTDVQGYWEMRLVPAAKIVTFEKKYRISFTGIGFVEVEIPNQAAIDFNELVLPD